MATARVSTPQIETSSEDSAKSVFTTCHWLLCDTAVEIAVPHFTVGDLLKLASGTVIQTVTPAKSELPIRIKGIQAGSGQLEVVGDRLAIRITELI